MKPLMLSGWIGILIGIIVVFGHVGHVAAQDSGLGKNCWTPAGTVASPLTSASEIESAMNAANVKKCATANHHCVQYIAPKGKGGKFHFALECQAASFTCAADVEIKSVSGYQCFMCEKDGKGSAPAKDVNCKSLFEILNGATKCLTYDSTSEKPKPDLNKFVYCLDGCQALNSKKQYFLGCKADCAQLKTANSAITESCEDCNIESECRAKFADSVVPSVDLGQGKNCWTPAGAVATPLTSASEIESAMNAASVKKCVTKDHHCVQYIAPKGKGGKFHFALECQVNTFDCKTSVEIKGVTGYQCFMCEKDGTGTAPAKDVKCKDLSEILNGAPKCLTYDSPSEKPKPDLNKFVYCLDGCQYLSSKTYYFLGCKADCAKVKTDNSAITEKCEDCTSEADCKAKFTTNPISQSTTTRTNGSTCLIGSMAILLFVVSMRQF